jgi:hypothetical protein
MRYAIWFVDALCGPDIIIHAFGPGDGNFPESPLTPIGKRLYGTTVAGGHKTRFGPQYHHGCVFSVPMKVPMVGSGRNRRNATYPYCVQLYAGSGGYYPVGGVIDVSGSLYGTMSTGGIRNNGTIFQL